uniref:uncharacterized protein LOC120328648 n=1 Tax=Styela clava TaxID=7725 RepID=UPI0019394C3A|nr:uncharacterized protein LOC120328648 [Styela clava]
MVEDHPKQTITVDGSTITTSNVLSKIPLQFIIDISSAASCNINPTYPPYSIQDGETFVISDTETFNETLYAYPSGSGGSITQFVVIGPLGLHQSEITDHGNDLFSSNMIWDATSDQSGDHTVCYYAVDSKGLHSEQRCFTITVTVNIDPCDVDYGGCSDTCITDTNSHSCLCDLNCWSIHDNDRTCLPFSTVECDGLIATNPQISTDNNQDRQQLEGINQKQTKRKLSTIAEKPSLQNVRKSNSTNLRTSGRFKLPGTTSEVSNC